MVKGSAPKVLNFFPLESSFIAEAEKFKKAVQASNSILISSTLTSDGDSIGAQLGIWNVIKGLKGSQKGLVIVNESPVPERYRFLKGTDQIQSFESFQKQKNRPLFDYGVTCDGGTERTGVVAPLFESIPGAALIDHHAVGSQRQYSARLLNIEASSTCEIVYLLHEYFELEVPPEIAESLYVGIVFDTGFFKHSLTKPLTHLVASRLISTGIDFSKISDRAILERSWEAQLLLKAMLDNMERSRDGRVIVSHWSQAEIEKIGVKDGDQEGMINQLYHTDSVEVVALLTERDSKHVKVSFRSKGKVNVAELARSLDPDGGGHIRAAGCSLHLSLAEAKKAVLSKIDRVLT